MITWEFESPPGHCGCLVFLLILESLLSKHSILGPIWGQGIHGGRGRLAGIMFDSSPRTGLVVRRTIGKPTAQRDLADFSPNLFEPLPC